MKFIRTVRSLRQCQSNLLTTGVKEAKNRRYSTSINIEDDDLQSAKKDNIVDLIESATLHNMPKTTVRSNSNMI
jgi:hypothetical protein